MRIEGAESTIFESHVASGPRNITTTSGGTHFCNGLNRGANANPSATCTSALDEVACMENFTYDATWSEKYEDFLITRISTSSETDDKYWGLFLNWKYTNLGGCQQETKPGDYVLWAYDAFNAKNILEMYPDEGSNVEKAERSTNWSLKLFVKDGLTGKPVQSATVRKLATAASLAEDVAVSDENGVATVSFSEKGTYYLKAMKPDSVRSNMVIMSVQ